MVTLLFSIKENLTVLKFINPELNRLSQKLF